MTKPFLILEGDAAGSHPAAGQTESFRTTRDALSGRALRELALATESAGFHGLSFADGPVAAGGVRLDATQRAAHVGPVTRSLALIPFVDTLVTEPFHVSTQLASLDYVSGGRGGWILGAANLESAAKAVGRKVVSEERRLEEAAAAVEVSRRLWDSWEDDAVIRNVETGQYVDADKIHYADFSVTFADGEGYSVKGSSIIPRPLQGQLPILAPADLVSADGALTPDAVDVVLTSAPSWELLVEEVASLRAAYGERAAGGPAIVVELDVVLDTRGESAEHRLAQLDAVAPWESPRARYVGDAAGLVAALTDILAAADGVRIHPAVIDSELAELAAVVLPALRDAGTIDAPAQDGTFRDLLGLERAANRYTTAAAVTGKE